MINRGLDVLPVILPEQAFFHVPVKPPVIGRVLLGDSHV